MGNIQVIKNQSYPLGMYLIEQLLLEHPDSQFNCLNQY